MVLGFYYLTCSLEKGIKPLHSSIPSKKALDKKVFLSFHQKSWEKFGSTQCPNAMQRQVGRIYAERTGQSLSRLRVIWTEINFFQLEKQKTSWVLTIAELSAFCLHFAHVTRHVDSGFVAITLTAFIAGP
jgi:hypothetical protein